MSVKDWRRMFTVETIQPEFHINIAPGQCDANCLEAKELKCTCKCNGRNHGATLRSHVKPLTQFSSIIASNRLICHFCRQSIAPYDLSDSVLYDAHVDCLELWHKTGSYAEIY
ncbi:MAG TPA: hypothetical protein VJZ03_06730 [Candidatus Bathyarchaeia archaeon]|nr:hypothetical protein [Candidatus Bathyarchaeia archaeon]